MKKLVLILCLIVTLNVVSFGQDWIFLYGQVTDIETGAGIPDHYVFATFSDSTMFATFQTNEAGYYGDTIFPGGFIGFELV